MMTAGPRWEKGCLASNPVDPPWALTARCYDRAVHDSPAPAGRGGLRSLSRRDALRYGATAPALVLFGPVAATLTGPTASAAGMRLIDFTHRLVPPDQIKSAGFDGALVYVSELRPGADFDFKPVTRGYADALRAADLHVVSCYQYGKPGWPTPSDYTRGYDGGVADARTALRLHAAAGGPGSAPIFFSVDEDIDDDTWNTVAVEWFRGINSVLGVHRTGIYGHSRACAWAIADGMIGRSTTPDHWWAWQTKAWSAGEREPRAVLYQSVVVTASEPGVALGGTHVDVDEVLASDFGQWDLDRSARR
uniref:Twin-arginine translocation pathway signal n=1 Tax=Mycobacterium sp. (strain JLS) TaxID=164757 RepID=A0A5Q5CE35_MYCSJ|nr:DUF1906 domain-containing protein [Mycolicibacterium monacense]